MQNLDLSGNTFFNGFKHQVNQDSFEFTCARDRDKCHRGLGKCGLMGARDFAALKSPCFLQSRASI